MKKFLPLIIIFSLIISIYPIWLYGEAWVFADEQIVNGKSSIVNSNQSGNITIEQYNNVTVELIEKRTWNSKTFKNPDGKYAWEGSTGPIHYQDEEGKWQDIDTTVKPSSDPNYDYENTENNFKSYFKKFPGQDMARYQGGESSIITSLLDNELGKVLPNEGYSKDNTFYYPDAYEDIDVKYSIGSIRLLEEFIIPNYERIKDIDSITHEVRLENAIPEIQEDSSINFYHPQTKESLWFTPRPFMYELNDELKVNYGLHYEITKQDENTYIITKVLGEEGKKWLASPDRTYPVVIDDNVTYTGAGDGRVVASGSNYGGIHDETSGSAAVVTNTVGQKYDSLHFIYRLFMYFDTSGLPDDATIDAGTKIQLCCETPYLDTNFDVCTLKGTQGTTIEPQDYDAWDLETEGADRWNTVNYVDEQYIDLPLNATGRGWIDKEGNTYFCFRSLEDINSSPPTDSEFVKFRASDDLDQEPKLYVVYSMEEEGGYEMASDTYRVWQSSINVGGWGGSQTSTSYHLRETIGEIATGLSTSTLYKLFAGYQPMQEVYLALSAPSEVSMSPSIGGVSGGTSTGTATTTVITDSPSGYSLNVKASDSPAMATSSYSFDDYIPAIADTPDYSWSIPATSSEFGFTPEGSDIVQKFLDNGSDTCNTGFSETTDACWYNFSTSDETIAQTYSANHPSGTQTIIKFKAESGTQNIQAPGEYQATITITAIPN